MNKKMIFVCLMSALLVTGCGSGGGGTSSSGGGGTTSSGITTTTSPTAKFSSTATGADASTLTKEIQGGTPAMVSAATMQTIPVAISTLPAGVSGSLPCSYFGTSGSGSVTYDTNMSSSGTITAGTYINMTFSGGCNYTNGSLTVTLSGQTSVNWTRYNSSTDQATTNTYTSFTMGTLDSSTSPATSNTYGPISGSYTVDISGGTMTVAMQLPNGGATNLSYSNVYDSGTTVTISNATYVYNSSAAGGIIKVVFSNWIYDSSTGYPNGNGTITVTDANGDTLVITESSTSVTAVYNYAGGGSSAAYSVTFP